MALSDVWLRNFLIESTLFRVVLIFTGFILIIKIFYNKLYAFMLDRTTGMINKNKHLRSMKQNLFRTMEPGKVLVEIGAGTGANFEFYPACTSVLCVDQKSEFEGYVSKSCKKAGEHLGEVTFVTGIAENLSAIVQPNSVDYVVCTLVLCSVKDERQVISEVKKVLKPGGTFFFFEHVAAPEEHKAIRILQKFLLTPVIKVLCGNCHFDGTPWIHLEAAGFSRLEYSRPVISSFRFLSPLRYICVGSATK